MCKRKTRQEKDQTTQDQTSQVKTTHDKTRHDKGRKGKESKAKEGKTRQGKAREGKTRREEGSSRKSDKNVSHTSQYQLGDHQYSFVSYPTFVTYEKKSRKDVIRQKKREGGRKRETKKTEKMEQMGTKVTVVMSCLVLSCLLLSCLLLSCFLLFLLFLLFNVIFVLSCLGSSSGAGNHFMPLLPPNLQDKTKNNARHHQDKDLGITLLQSRACPHTGHLCTHI